MKATITVNLNGLLFHIEEEAYKTLKKYLDKTAGYFKDQSESKEILNDLESRIAELLKERLGKTREVVNIEDIEEEQLPEEMKGMTVEERKAYVEEKSNERGKIQKRINELSEERRKYIADKLADGEDNTLDAAMLKVIREQAADKNYSFE